MTSHSFSLQCMEKQDSVEHDSHQTTHNFSCHAKLLNHAVAPRGTARPPKGPLLLCKRRWAPRWAPPVVTHRIHGSAIYGAMWAPPSYVCWFISSSNYSYKYHKTIVLGVMFTNLAINIAHLCWKSYRDSTVI